VGKDTTYREKKEKKKKRNSRKGNQAGKAKATGVRVCC
jgi:hypothetical protein